MHAFDHQGLQQRKQKMCLRQIPKQQQQQQVRRDVKHVAQW
jgi:hypothetical protein